MRTFFRRIRAVAETKLLGRRHSKQVPKYNSLKTADLVLQNGKQVYVEYKLNYIPVLGKRSTKAERFVEFCIADYEKFDAIKCSRSEEFLEQHDFARFEVLSDRLRLHVTLNDHQVQHPRDLYDHKGVFYALQDQRAHIPAGLEGWIVNGDNQAASAEFDHGIFLTGMRDFEDRRSVILPTSNRDRVTGPLLAKQMADLKKSWTDWSAKKRAVWWGGAISGSFKTRRDKSAFERRLVIEHFQNNPSPHVVFHPTEDGRAAFPDVELLPPFTKAEAFSHLGLLLLRGNDVPSGLSWYFCGNSPVLMAPPPMDHVLYFEIKPWEHYIPLTTGPADILDGYHWILNNPREAKDLVARTHERLRWFTSEEYLWATNEVLRRVHAHYQKTVN